MPTGRHAIPAKRPEKNDPAAEAKWVRNDRDIQLMLAFQDGQEDAFRTLVQRNQGKVYAMVYRLINDHALAEDLTQEVFLRVFRTAQRYRPMAKFSTWLYRITTNVALNAIHARRRMRFAPLDTAEDDGGSWHRHIPDTRYAAPHAELDVEELRTRLLQAIAALPENQRIAITLNKYEHMSYQEIADILECSTMAVKSLLARARGNLRDALAKYLGRQFAKKIPNP